MELIVVVVISAGIAENSLNGVSRSLIQIYCWLSPPLISALFLHWLICLLLVELSERDAHQEGSSRHRGRLHCGAEASRGDSLLGARFV